MYQVQYLPLRCFTLMHSYIWQILLEHLPYADTEFMLWLRGWKKLQRLSGPPSYPLDSSDKGLVFESLLWWKTDHLTNQPISISDLELLERSIMRNPNLLPCNFLPCANFHPHGHLHQVEALHMLEIFKYLKTTHRTSQNLNSDPGILKPLSHSMTYLTEISSWSISFRFIPTSLYLS